MENDILRTSNGTSVYLLRTNTAGSNVEVVVPIR
jgi:hypothetical protein